MTMMKNPKRQHPSWFSRFWAIVRYEMLWNIRKKKFIGILIAVFIIATLFLVVPVGISAYQGTKVAANPDAAITAGSSGFLYLLLAIGTAVNSISSEFESGTIVPLVTKPVSRTMIFLGKVFGVFIILVVSYIVLYGYSTVGSIIVYGPQHSLQYMPVIIVGGLISTFIWVSVLFAVGALSKNTITTVISVIILFLSFFFAAPIVNELAGPSPALNYFPGTGANGIIIGGAGNGTSVSSGTDSIGINIVNYALYSSAKVYYFQTNLTAVRAGETSVPTGALVYTEPTSLVATRSTAVAFAYVIGLLALAWVALKKSQILE